MTRRMLIDATHAGETRVAVVDSRNRLEDFDFETAAKAQVKGNVYLAKVTRVEPSLQAAFVEFGGNRHGFLPFNEIHTDYYQIPVADREALTAEADRESDGNGEASHNEDGDGEPVETVGGTDDSDADEAEDRRRRAFARRYKIQEVIKRRQILLVQVTKEERGTKGAALTTYLSLAGRYCVLMPNTPRGGGVSRKIASAQDRKRLRSVVEEMQLPAGMAVIVRTAGQDRTKTEIKRDCDYLMRLWSDIRENTMKSTAPALIHAEGDLVRRSIRDLYRGEIDELLVEGEEGYRAAKDFMRMLMPSHARRVKQYKNESVPLFHDCGIVGQIDDLHDLDVKLPAGGSIVINQTEALVAIDVNSGRATRERNIEETAYKTNLEAADEVARQLRLRDLAGLIVIDFIDMDDTRHVHAVERRLKAALANDRARIQLGRISPFGLMEMSRQRMRPSLIEATYNVCSTCGGTGLTRNIPSSALHVLRAAEESCMRGGGNLTVHTATPVALHILNDKRDDMLQIEQRFGVRLRILGDDSLTPPAYRIESDRGESGEARPESRVSRGDDRARSEEAPRQEERPRGEEEARGRRRPRRGRRRDGGEGEASSAETGEEEVSATPDAEGDSRERTTRDSEDGDGRPRRRRGRRGGRRRRRRDESSEAGESGQNDQAAASEPAHDDQTGDEQVGDAANGAGGEPTGDDDGRVAAADEATPPEPRSRRRPSRARRAASADDGAVTEESADGPGISSGDESRDDNTIAATATDESASASGTDGETVKPARRSRAKAKTKTAGKTTAKPATKSRTRRKTPARAASTAAANGDSDGDGAPQASGGRGTAVESGGAPAAVETQSHSSARRDAGDHASVNGASLSADVDGASDSASDDGGDGGANSASRRKGWWQRAFG